MINLREDVLELFAESQVNGWDVVEAAHWRHRKADYQAAYDAERAKNVRCDPVRRASRRAQHAKYEKKRWARIKADPKSREAHNAKRRAAHARLLLDSKRLAVAKAKQSIHSSRQTQRRRAAAAMEACR